MSPLTLTSDTEPLHEWAEDCALIPPIVHFASLSVRRTCSRSASVRVAGLLSESGAEKRFCCVNASSPIPELRPITTTICLRRLGFAKNQSDSDWGVMVSFSRRFKSQFT